MTTKTRKIFVAVAFAVTAAAGITGATLSGETKETDVAALCATSAWPNIPAECLEGDTNTDVRYVSMDNPTALVVSPEKTLRTVAILPTDHFVPFWGNSAS
ncbi:MAG: hypothetical protein GY798_28820 [Hyphomicrobiales bacterium]|nr:hypothetical protein [Hyphomicrobiales bacterium]